MRVRSLLILGLAAVLVLSGCAPEPEPTPTPSRSADPAPSATPTDTPVTEPETAFDVTCEDVASAMTAALGEMPGTLSEALPLWSSPSWYPGPAQYMFQRAGGIACAQGDAARNWEVSIVPGAQDVTEGAASRDGFWGEEARCESTGYCSFQVVEGDVLVSAGVVDTALGEGDASRIEDALRAVGSSAADTVREVEQTPSEIAGVECSRLLTAADLEGLLGAKVFLIDAFGGWGIPSEVYQEVNGARICYYASDESEYSSQGYVALTSLPGGAWAFERLDTEKTVTVDGADDARAGVDESGRPVLDLRLGADWLRLTTYEGSGISDLRTVAAEIVENYTADRPAAP